MCNRYSIKNVILNKDACNDKSVRERKYEVIRPIGAKDP